MTIPASRRVSPPRPLSGAPQVTAYQEMAETAMKTVATVQEEAEVRVAEEKDQAHGETEAFRSDYPTRLNFPYRLEDKAIKWPFLVEGMWE